MHDKNEGRKENVSNLGKPRVAFVYIIGRSTLSLKGTLSLLTEIKCILLSGVYRQRVIT